MSQSKTHCPHCYRWPGGIHEDDCPRSRASHAALAARMMDAGRPRLVWKKGLIGYKPRAKSFLLFESKMKWIDNPGVPCVKYGRNPRIGGIPAGKKAEAGEFLRALGLE